MAETSAALATIGFLSTIACLMYRSIWPSKDDCYVGRCVGYLMYQVLLMSVWYGFTPSSKNVFRTHVDYPAQHTNGVGAVQVVVPIDIFDQAGHYNNDLHFFTARILLGDFASWTHQCKPPASMQFKSREMFMIRIKLRRNLCCRCGFRELFQKQKKHPSESRLQVSICMRR